MTAAMLLMMVAFSGCKDDSEEWPVTNGNPPVLTMESKHLVGSPGSSIYLKGHIEDADGIRMIKIECPSLYLDKTIDIIKIYGKALNSYDLDYRIDLSPKETGDLFRINVGVTDVAGKTVTQEVTVDLTGDVS